MLEGTNIEHPPIRGVRRDVFPSLHCRGANTNDVRVCFHLPLNLMIFSHHIPVTPEPWINMHHHSNIKFDFFYEKY
ncbi:hypothetical protein CANTEDRAFT_113456 [Yamadazyma tenuis ATCC 10573]|uniref:Uncharacterized protein n=1 Tax=Candida tenuis (strain ATCC 10573 / BCRC 21748 / CBS 615 / JCM 9827 / NBRC 10315 / NRRL Y-1498 / VKM Y-70) TaxID=590646 RepID=G3B2G4_CANTC|nr:uncharacterized protein CANTEDRAFT_113456 [Yamadazyma tenuis ATCC 10573]EGV64668.1 hypothetical protein CANTEDRAFT_113456 [Yamadazyma tenuis ATCC 10573]